MPPSHIAVIGGGLTGLSSAIHLASRLPAAKITLIEQSPRLGGWVDSKRVHVKDGRGNEASMLLEKGPRTLRPNAHSVLEMINVLQLQSSVITVPKTAPAARGRFLHIPEVGPGLAPLPAMPHEMLETDLGMNIAAALGSEVFRRESGGAYEHDDKSVDEFLTQHFGEDIARILGSALVHGIYAADSRVLSVRAAFPYLWQSAIRGNGSVIRGLFLEAFLPRSKPPSTAIPYFVGDVKQLMANASVYSFRNGMITLVNAMEDALNKRANVEVLKNEEVTLIESKKDGAIPLHLASGRLLTPSHIVSAVPLPAFRKMVEQHPHNVPPHLTANPISSVTVVNLVFPPTPADQPIHPEGFGYLVPRDDRGHVDVLGTVFDSCSLSAQDDYPSDSAPRFTKMTMMIRADPIPSTAASPVTQEAVMKHLTRHIAPESPLPDPVYFEASTLRDCIPVPAVGHLNRMREMKRAADHIWHECLEIIGAGVGGVSVGDCIKQGREVGSRWM